MTDAETTAGYARQAITGKPWRLTMGMRPLDLADWLEVDARRHAELLAKQALLASSPEVVTGSIDGSEPGSTEVLDEVVGWLERTHPGLVLDQGTQLVETTLGITIDRTGAHPLTVASQLVQEDLCLMERRGGAWVLSAASVCFPSRWDLRSKVGCDLDSIHGPVPSYEEQLASSVAKLFDRLDPARAMWRLNWSLLETDELHLPSPAARRAEPRADEPLFVRVERQTVRTMPRTGGVLFTIGTHVIELDRLLEVDSSIRADLAATLATVPSDAASYKGWVGRIDALLARLS